MDAPLLLDVQQIRMAFGGLLALNGATLQLYQGEILGLVGPNGSGKTTLLNVISGQLRPTGGNFSGKRAPFRGCPPIAAPSLALPVPTKSLARSVPLRCWIMWRWG